ncbi:MAG: N-acetylmuramoyl-L-alanine amidase [Chloroflexota bacterium]
MNRIGDRRDAIRACAGIVLALLGDVAVARADDGDTSTAPDAVALRPVAAAPPPDGPASDMIRVPRPVVPPGPRRVGIQAGHWKMAEVPDEMARLAGQTGTSAAGFVEWQVNLDIAGRVAARLQAQRIAVDILPATVPEGYLADAFISLHADGDRSGLDRGYKAAHGSRRGPYEPRLVTAIIEEYGRTTGLPWLPGVSRNMTGYYAFAWGRLRSTVAPHVPAAILEMGFLTNAEDRAMLVGQPDRVADGIARGIMRFLEEVPAGAAFADDLLVPPAPSWWRRMAPGT